MFNEVFTSPIARSVFVGVPLGKLLRPSRAEFALRDFGLGSHTTLDAALSELDGYVLNSHDLSDQARREYDAAVQGLGQALDAYLGSRLDAEGRISPRTAQLQALQNANNAFVEACAALAEAWGPGDNWDDWSDRHPDGVKAVALAQAIASEYVRASGIEFEVRERGLASAADALSVLREVDRSPEDVASEAERKQEEEKELADFYTWRDGEEGKRIAEALTSLGGYTVGPWEGGAPDLTGTGSAEGGAPDLPGGGDAQGGGGDGSPGGEVTGGEVTGGEVTGGEVLTGGEFEG